MLGLDMITKKRLKLIEKFLTACKGKPRSFDPDSVY